MSVQTHTSDEIDVTFDSKRCIHARKCVLGLPDVFQANADEDWIKPANARVEDLVAVIESCPSGALQYHRKAGPAETPPEVNTVRVWENGPLEVHAEIALEGGVATHRAVLCRCGLSKIKPYCNGAHKRRFEATGEVDPVEGEKLEARDGPLKISPFKDGPLGLEGNVELISGSGAKIATLTETALCRCGQSKNKPFCDGSHNEVGFEADGV